MADYWTRDDLLADFIDNGLATQSVVEVEGAYLELHGTLCFAGTLGIALIGKTKCVERAIKMFTERSRDVLAVYAIAHLLNINPNLALAVEIVHSPRAGRSSAKIANRLRQGTPLLLLEPY